MNSMSQITDILNKLDIWIPKNIPEKASQLKPGLSYQKIKEQVEHLPFEVPESIPVQKEIYISIRNATK